MTHCIALLSSSSSSKLDMQGAALLWSTALIYSLCLSSHLPSDLVYLCSFYETSTHMTKYSGSCNQGRVRVNHVEFGCHVEPSNQHCLQSASIVQPTSIKSIQVIASNKHSEQKARFCTAADHKTERANTTFERPNITFERARITFERANITFERANLTFERAPITFERANT